MQDEPVGYLLLTWLHLLARSNRAYCDEGSSSSMRRPIIPDGPTPTEVSVEACRETDCLVSTHDEVCGDWRGLWSVRIRFVLENETPPPNVGVGVRNAMSSVSGHGDKCMSAAGSLGCGAVAAGPARAWNKQ